MDRIVRRADTEALDPPEEGETTGLRAHWLAGPTNDERLDVAFLRLGPGGGTPPHTHIGGQVLHVVSGRGYVETDGRRLEIGPGDLVITAAGGTHAHGAADDSEMAVVSVTTGGYSIPDPVGGKPPG